MAVSVRSGWEEKTVQNLLAGMERFSLLFWQICGGIENPHCFDSRPRVLAQ
jgi:hypothetical protein